MANRFWGLTIATVLLGCCVATPSGAGEAPWPGRGPQPLAPEEVRHDGTSFRPPVVQPRWNIPTAAAPGARVSSWTQPVRLPPTHQVTSGSVPFAGPGPAPISGQHADGTWREDGRYIIINLDGREVRLVKESAPVQNQANAPGRKADRKEGPRGTIFGRLLDGRQPMANCQVKIIPLKKGLGGVGPYAADPSRQPVTVTADARGVYCFEDVSAGAYKLSWLPQGANQWIRRISQRPDVMVRAYETTQLKDVGRAQRTLD